jgi:hypothetical protein
LFGELEMVPFRKLPPNVITPAAMQRLRKTDQLTPVSSQPAADANRLLGAFLSRAYRRPVNDGDIAPYLGIVRQHLDRSECFESAMLSAYRAVLCSPDFLFLVGKPGPLDEYKMAERLSYFLWRTAPDETLREAADRGELRKPEVLRRETERLLASPRAQAFVTDFLDQWLHLREFGSTQPEMRLFPEFYVEDGGKNFKEDPLLIHSMLDETRMFFTDLLKNDSSLLQLIDSDFTFLNQRLAAFYKLPPVNGTAMQRVVLPTDSPRGGVLTQASVLKVTANGTTTSPVVRGAYVMARLLGKPPEPPPPNIPAVEPDVQGSTTIRELLDKHRADASCASCHAKMDPPGLALENFDAIGGWRDRYRLAGQPKKVRVGTGKESKVVEEPTVEVVSAASRRNRVKLRLGSAVDATGVLADGRTFADINGLRALLLKDEDALARNLAQQLMIYATGAGIRFSDRAAIDAIVAKTKATNHGLRSLVQEVVASELFQTK